MTKHDEIRQILHDSGYKFKDHSRSALDMTDEEVDAFVIEFVTKMSQLGRQMTKAMGAFTATIVKTVESLQDLGKVLDERDKADARLQHH